MAEQKQEHKWARAIRQIIKWLSVGFLAILLVLALVFQAPWKVIMPLAILLAALALVPDRAQKWLWLSVSVILIAIVIWIFLPDGGGTWTPFTFTQELAAHEAKYAIPDNQNAAIIYDTLLQDYVPNEWRMRFLPKEVYDQTLSEPWFSRDYPVLAQWLDKHQEIVATLPEACRVKTC